MKAIFYYLAVIPLMVVLALSYDAVMCKNPPTGEFQRLILIREVDKQVLFKVQAKLNCLLSTEGSFPDWSQNAWIQFNDVDDFLNGTKEHFVFGVDFVGNTIRSGDIMVDRKTRVATLSLEFVDRYEFSAPVNGSYHLDSQRVLN